MIASLLRTVGRQAAVIRRQEGEIIRLSRGYRKANDSAEQALACFREANDQTDQAIAAAKQWKERAETLADLVPADVLAVLDEIGSL